MIIRDVVHHDIIIEEKVIEELISTYEFQRLRKIKQLGLSFMVFPSTEHSRFTHSIGVYNMAKNFIKVLETKENTPFDADEKQALIIASLLHDLGHGPLSHASEDIFKFNHEDYSIKIIEQDCTEINKVLNKHCPDLINQIILFIKKDHPNKILNKILSGTIDIDRMDYLIRDSHHAGVEYGKFDYSRMVQLIDVYDGELVYLEKGINTIEDFIMSRYHMFSQVYLNQKAIGYEVLAKMILQRAKQLYHEGYVFTTNITLLIPFLSGKEIDTCDYVLMNDFVLLDNIDSFARIEADPELKALAYGFITQKMVTSKVEGREYYTLACGAITKKIYNESVLIKTNNGEIKKLEDISPLINFISTHLHIENPEKNLYLEKDAL